MTPTTSVLTLEAFLQLPDLEESPAWEFLAGKMQQKPMPTIHHSILQKRLVAAIDQAAGDYEAFPELRYLLSQQSVVPNITILQTGRVPVQNRPVTGAPEWLIEILSPDQSTTKLIAKIQACLLEGSQLAWLIDGTEQAVMVFWPDRPLVFCSGSAVLPVLPGLNLSLSPDQMFAWLPQES